MKEFVSFRAGLQTTQNGKFYAMSTKFDKFSNEGKTLVVQFTVKHEQKIDCGGGYVKVRWSSSNCLVLGSFLLLSTLVNGK